ncbi:NEW3 domain-containing protein [Micromonospora yasonensis]|uniref:NEW3 domain-containing protein n=1 Tax=Micromonospora yasonensis TaxID=1128667 RepID=UPI002230F722|nr:NEW3 domain-containing protein [Micromonospora yasonensis]MCW3840680.1 NEW3 domain-containing protein [Micromonospora yasonensis]
MWDVDRSSPGARPGHGSLTAFRARASVAARPLSSANPGARLRGGTSMMLIRKAAAAASACVLAVGLSLVGTPQPAAALDNGLALTPPMGWNPFNHYKRDATAELVKAQARAMVDSGMKDAGYTYVNLDGGWNLPERNAAGELQPDPKKFPDGIKPVVDYVHSLGLKFGIYNGAGLMNCARTSAGSYGHYEQDARLFASWEVDYLKLDWCVVPYENHPDMTREQVDRMLAVQMRDALAATGRPIAYSLSGGGGSGLWSMSEVWRWGSEYANLWRTCGDIGDNYRSMVKCFQLTVAHHEYAGPGGWNDPDMLQVGNGGMTTTEYRSHFSLWAQMAAPLLAGNDLTTMSADIREILTNREVIAVDQDPLGRPGYPVANTDGHWVLSKPLADGGRSVVLFNDTATPALITTGATEVGLPAAPAYQLRDLWQHSTTETASTISAVVPPHAVVMYRVKPIANPTSAPPHILTGLSPEAASVTAGQPMKISQTFTNTGALPATDVELRLNTPAGWAVQAGSATRFPIVHTDETVQVNWTVVPPASPDPVTTATLTGTVGYWYEPRTEQASASGDVTVTVVGSVTEPYRAFASTPAHLGQSGSRFTIKADGADMWTTRDDYGTVYVPGALGTTGTATMQVTAQQPVDGWAKAGLIIRNDLTLPRSSPGYLILAVTAEHGVVLQWDSNANGYIDIGTPSGGGEPVALPVWLKVVRDGDSFTGYYSTDGGSWTSVGTVSVPGTTLSQDVGMFATSHRLGTMGRADFTDFMVS